MLSLVSPAKKLNFESDTTSEKHTMPHFLDEATELVGKARTLSRGQLAQSMKISDNLADLNYRRFQDFSTPFDLGNAKQAALVFNGDTYVGLDAETLDQDDMAFAQDHLGILSGLYGLLRPLDLMQPYRLEMGAKFQPPQSENLYGFWDGQITEHINKTLSKHANNSVINLASNEYFKVIKQKLLSGAVITPVFKEIKDGEARTLGMFAKRARGMMARYIIKTRLDTPDGIKKFKGGGYKYRKELSNDHQWVFTRQQP